MKPLLLAVLVGGLLAIGGCIPQGGDPKLTSFSFQGGSCGAGEGKVEVAPQPGALVFSGQFAAPSPCHRLKAVLQKIASQHQIVLSILLEEPLDPCAQCLALIPYSGRIEGLGTGRWHVRIYHQDRKVLQGEFDVPAAP